MENTEIQMSIKVAFKYYEEANGPEQALINQLLGSEYMPAKVRNEQNIELDIT